MRRLLLVLLALLGSSPVLAADPPPRGRLEMPYRTIRLDNGLVAILHRDTTIPVVSVNTWYHVGSGRERPGRTGFAHLFEHLMFMGSQHVPTGDFDRLLEAAGAVNNGSTTEDRTNYWETAPSNALDLPLFLESDRMAYLLDNVTPDLVDGQRDVVKNELRQGILNQPYGILELELPKLLFPPEHPYSWPVIGSMEDLTAASQEDVTGFFRDWYGPGNASVVVAGDIDLDRAEAAVRRWFGEVPARPPVPAMDAPPVRLQGETRKVLQDKVQLPKLVLAWIGVPAFHPSEAALDVLADVLAEGKTSRLYKALVHEGQIAQSVDAFNDGRKVAGVFAIEILARPGHSLTEILAAADREIRKVADEGIAPDELQRAVNGIETEFLGALESVAGFGGKADLLNRYFFYTGNPDYADEDLARFHALSPGDVQNAARSWLGPDRVVVSIVPEGSKGLAVEDAR